MRTRELLYEALDRLIDSLLHDADETRALRLLVCQSIIRALQRMEHDHD